MKQEPACGPDLAAAGCDVVSGNNGHGLGVFAARDFLPGEEIFVFSMRFS